MDRFGMAKHRCRSSKTIDISTYAHSIASCKFRSVKTSIICATAEQSGCGKRAVGRCLADERTRISQGQSLVGRPVLRRQYCVRVRHGDVGMVTSSHPVDYRADYKNIGRRRKKSTYQFDLHELNSILKRWPDDARSS